MSHTNATIYGLALPDGVIRYVGQTVRPLSNRLGRHRYAARHGNSLAVCVWMRDIGPENVEISPLEVCAYEDRLDRERQWILKLNTSIDGGGFNSWVRGAMSPDILERLRAQGAAASRAPRPRSRGQKRSDETRQRMRESQRAVHEKWRRAEFERTGVWL